MSDDPKTFDATRRMLLGAALAGLVAGTVGTAQARGRGGGFGGGARGGFGGAMRSPGGGLTARPAGTPTFAPGAGRLATGARLSGTRAICARCRVGCWRICRRSCRSR